MELLVVLTILGLALLLATPALERNLPGLELRTGTRDVASALREARARAIGRNEEVTMVVDRHGGTLRANGKQMLQLSRRIAILTEMSVSSGIDDNEIHFFPDGTSNGGQLTLVLGERREHVLVDWLTGAISIAE